MRKSILATAALAGAATVSLATGVYADDSVTMNGITIYGTYDIGVAYQTHGAPLSSTFYPGLDYLISKASNRSMFSVAPNGLSQTMIGVRGAEALDNEFSAVFRIEVGFEPQSGTIADSSKSLTLQNGVALANQTASADGSRTGQVFNGQTFAGVSSKDFGTFTIGRHNSPLLDDIIAYDPQGASYAFSVIGFSGVTAGAGDTQDTRLDDSVKYNITYGPVHGAALYQFAGIGGNHTGAYEISGGIDYMGFSIDGVYSHVNDAISASALSAAQVSQTAPLLPTGSLAATVSDNTAYTVNGRYTYGPAKLYAGYERIEYANPTHPLTTVVTNNVVTQGVADIGGYELSVLNDTAYTIHKVLDVIWTGLKYSVNPNLDITGAFYHYSQNSYKGNGCSDTSFAQCSGSLNAYSMSIDYRVSSRFDVYGGFMMSNVSDGLANGYLHQSTVDPMVGARFKF